MRRMMGLAAVAPVTWRNGGPGALGSTATGRRVSRNDGARLAVDESFWSGVQDAFSIDRSVIYLNNGGVCASPRQVQQSLESDRAFTNRLPSRHLWTVLEPRLEGIRTDLAETFGCEPDELAFTRNATEALETAQLGIRLEPGDEVLTTNQDFPRMLDTWRQRAAREGIVLRTIPVPTPVDDPAQLVRMFEREMTSRTRAVLFCHVNNLSGQIYPVREICRMARARGAVSIVDGAQALGHLPFECGDLECDVYGTSLHKYFMAPLGTGFLYVRRELIPRVWPLFPASESAADDIRKFEVVGTHPAAPHNAVADAIQFHRSLGANVVAERLRVLTARWVGQVRSLPGVSFRAGFDARHSCGIATVTADGVDHREVAGQLWDNHRIVVRAVSHDDCTGIRVTPHVYNTFAEVDRFARAFTQVLERSRG